MTVRPRLLVLTILLSAPMLGDLCPVRGQAPSEVLASIKALKCHLQGESVLVSYRVEGAMGHDVRSSLEGGLTVTFVHKLAVVRRRALFFAKSLAHREIESSATLDTLTQQYTLTRKVDDVPSETSSTDRVQDVERWLNEVHDVNIALPPGSVKGTLELRVKTQYQTNYYVLWILPWSLSAIDEKECR